MKPFLIAEISSNHNADLQRAKEMIKLAADVGFDAVKVSTVQDRRVVFKRDFEKKQITSR